MSIKKLLSVILIIILSNFSLNYGFGKELNVSGKHNFKLFVSDRKEKSDSIEIKEVKTTSDFNAQSLKNRLFALKDILIEEENISPTDSNLRQKAQFITNGADSLVNKAHALHKKIITESRLMELVDFQKAQNLPFGINKNLGGIDYLIAFDRIIFTPSGGKLSAFMSLEIPQNGKRIAFKDDNINFNKSGIGAKARLQMIEDFPIKVGEKMLINLKADKGKTFVAFDCQGYKNMGIDAELELSRDMLIPENPDGSLSETGRVKGNFEVPYMSEWGEILAKVSLSPFQVNGLKGFTFQVNDAIFDFSEVANAPGIIFPRNYTSTSLPNPNNPLWQGVFIKNVSITLPKEFKKTDDKRLSFFAENFILDEVGISGNLGVKNLLPLNQGSMDTWKFSIDSLYLSLAMNQLSGGGFAGLLEVPIFDDDPLKYSAAIALGGNYNFTVNTTGTKKIPLWGAEAELWEGSGVQINVVESRFLPKINLNGKLNVGGEVSLADITFQNLQVQTIKPYIQIGALSLASEKLQQRMAGFPITINNIGALSKDDDTGLDLDVVVNFVGEEDGGFGATAGLIVWGEQKTETGRQKFKYKSTEITDVSIDVDGGAYKLKGDLSLYKQHAVYGKGFKGSITATFTPGLEVKATAQFGNVNNFRYWYADALATLPNGIMVAPGFGLYGFGGGAYYHMRQNVTKTITLPANENNNPLDQSADAGKSLTGIVYVPDQTVFLGIKATVVVGTHPSPQPFNGDASFEIAFNDKAGIDFISFSGKAYFMTPMDKRNANAPVYASLKIDYDVANSSLFGNLGVYMNVAGGMMKGIQPDNKSGSAVVYFSPSAWYIHIGTPEKRIGLKLMHIFESTSYIMVGTQMPAMPAPPANVSAILGGDYNFMRDEDALKSGSGFAFGASMAMSTGDLTFLIFYANLTAGAGFDIMLKNYGDDVRCAGRAEPLGINGFYGSGQAYAYLSGKIGIKVDLTFVKGNYDIIKLGAAALLQTKLPNPFWMKGTVGGHYSILGGLISGKCKFELTIGEQCQIVGGSAVSGIRIIAETSPGQNEKKVNVFNAPQAAFNISINKVFELVDIDDQKKSFRAVMDYFKITEPSSTITGTLKWNANNDVVAFEPFEILPPNKTIKLSLKVHFEEQVNGVWQPLRVNNKVVEETAESTFETGTAPDFIPASNVSYSYPCLNQYNFYKDESTLGYIQLIRGQSYLFQPGAEWKQTGRFVQGQSKYNFDFAYNTGEKKITFNIPKEKLLNEKVYSFKILNVPVKENAKIDANVKTQVENQSKTEGVTVNVATKDVEGTLSLLQEKELFSTHFKTSKFSTFASKMNSITNSNGWIWDIMTAVNELGSNLTTSEYFDKYEIQGTKNSKPLIQYEAILDNKWYTNEIYPLIYQEYPLAGKISVDWRQTDSLGLPPVRAIYLRQTPDNKLLEENEVTNGTFSPVSDYAAFIYNLSLITYKDYEDLRRKAAIEYTKGGNASLGKLLSSYYPILGSGKYKMKVKYVLPGTENATSEKEIVIIKP